MATDTDTALRKRCTSCNEEFPATLVHYPPHKMGQYGLNPRCRSCKKAADTALRARPDQRARQKAWRDANRAKVRDYNVAYRAAGYSSTEHVAQWRSENLEHARNYSRERERIRRLDPAYRLKSRISVHVRMAVKGKGGRSLETVLGYSIATLRAHLERQFTKGMNWDRFMAGEIEIDHILPVSFFKFETVDHPDFRVCWALSNLQPMWARDNRSKNAKRLTLL